MLRKMGPLTFFPLHKIFKRALRQKLPTTVTFAAPSKRVEGATRGDSTHRRAAVRPVPRGSTNLKSGPACLFIRPYLSKCDVKLSHPSIHPSIELNDVTGTYVSGTHINRDVRSYPGCTYPGHTYYVPRI